jgi:hypothetical protein
LRIRWGAPKIPGELLKLGIDVAQSTVSIYMVPRQGRPLQAWKTHWRFRIARQAKMAQPEPEIGGYLGDVG